MKAQRNNLIIDTPPAEDAPVGMKKCRHCGKHFRSKQTYYVCCSWDCTLAYKKAQADLEALEAQEYKGHPF